MLSTRFAHVRAHCQPSCYLLEVQWRSGNNSEHPHGHVETRITQEAWKVLKFSLCIFVVAHTHNPSSSFYLNPAHIRISRFLSPQIFCISAISTCFGWTFCFVCTQQFLYYGDTIRLSFLTPTSFCHKEKSNILSPRHYSKKGGYITRTCPNRNTIASLACHLNWPISVHRN